MKIKFLTIILIAYYKQIKFKTI